MASSDGHDPSRFQQSRGCIRMARSSSDGGIELEEIVAHDQDP